jgi:tetratricopeptide (TPR) repeat protein
VSTENEHPDDERDDDVSDSDSASDESSSDTDGTESDTSVAAASDEQTSSDGGEEDEDDAPEQPAARASVKSSSAASAGARLAAAKAAKAAKKAAKKQTLRDEAGVAQQSAFERAKAEEPRDAQEILTQSPLGRAATKAGEWAEANRQIAIGVAAVAAVALFGWLGWSWWTGNQAAAAGALLTDAMEISAAEIVTPDAEAEAEPDDDDATPEADAAPTFETLAARNDAALAAYRRVSTEYPSSTAATWAKLGEGRTLLDQGEYEAARTAYEAAFHASGEDTVIAWQALEGIGASYEAERNWDEATSTYERLSGIADGAYTSAASYHLARMHAASGDESGALTAFRELVESLQEDSEDGEPAFPYVLAQAELRLRELDPSSGGSGPSPLTIPGGDGGGVEGLEGMDPEQIQELIRQLQTKSGGGAH